MRLPRYRFGAPVYDVLSGEALVYRPGRVRAVQALRLRPGDRVLDVGCGTGLSLELLVPAVGPRGAVVGTDLSADMLRQARRRIAGRGWSTVGVERADAADPPESVRRSAPFDAVLFAYVLGIVPDWHAAWRYHLDLVRPGGRVAVVDTAPPTGAGRLLAPLARLAFVTGGVHPDRRVWELVERDLTDVDGATLRSGHVRLAGGTRG